ncbi:MAG: hypothetical protein KDA64_17260, partial [Rhodospirillaceae bacterium]|nr:hypothetical protein [Rhodospirillaceae bacterium]
MFAFVDAHGYLLADLLGLPAVLAAFVVLRSQRRLLLLAGLVETAHSPPLVYFQNRYWSPDRITGGWWRPEDVIVCFSLGCLVWAAAMLPLRRRLVIDLSVRVFAGRILAIAAATLNNHQINRAGFLNERIGFVTIEIDSPTIVRCRQATQTKRAPGDLPVDHPWPVYGIGETPGQLRGTVGGGPMANKKARRTGLRGGLLGPCRTVLACPTRDIGD